MGIGIWQLVIILVIVLLLFGAGKLPRVMGDLAKGIKNFKSGLKDEDEVSAGSDPKALKDEGTAQPAETTAARKDEAART